MANTLGKKWEDDLTRHSLQANASVQDIGIKNEVNDKAKLHAEIGKARRDLLSFREKIEDLENAAKLADKETEKIGLEAIAKKHRQELNRLHAALRKAHLVSSTAIEKQEKEDLVSSSNDGLRNRNIKDKESAVKASASITDNLINVSRMMSEQLQRSNDSVELLANSSTNITSTNEELKGMQGHIKNARTLLTKYDRREMTDKLFIFLSIVFFFATVVYIIKKRVWPSSGTEDYIPTENSELPDMI